MPPDLLTILTQFGVSGLIAWMWLTERRASAQRERQLSESHERLIEQRVQLDVLLRVVADNARAVSALEATQRALAHLIDSLASGQAQPQQRIAS